MCLNLYKMIKKTFIELRKNQSRTVTRDCMFGISLTLNMRKFISFIYIKYKMVIY